MKNLHILMRTHSEDYEGISSIVIVGVTEDKDIAHAFLQVGMFQTYYDHEVEIVTMNVLQDYKDVQKQIADWLDPKVNPMCECGHRLLHHRRKNGSGSCKWNMPHHHDKSQRHACKGFKLMDRTSRKFRSIMDGKASVEYAQD